MFTRLKIQLTLIFTVIVAFLQIVAGLLFIWYQLSTDVFTVSQFLQDVWWAVADVVAISSITFFIGYIFVDRNLQPAADMLIRLQQFTQDASHELKTPISVANSSLDLALKTHDDKYIYQAKSELKRASHLVEKLLELAKLDRHSLEKDKLNLNKLISEVVKQHRPRLKKSDITIDFNPEKSVDLEADRELLYQAIANLMDNAIKFNSEKGKICLYTSKRRFKITNTGSKIPDKQLPFLFDRFYQAEESRQSSGFGIGLAFVKNVCEMHGWTISVTSDNELTSFTIRF